MKNYEVVVGNIGSVHKGNNPIEANKEYGNWKLHSDSGFGRAAGEPVTLFVDGEIKWEHPGTNSTAPE
jgi:hypothetical protein